MERTLERGKTSDKLESIHSDIEEVKGIMTENINRLVNRGEALDHLRCRTEDLVNKADNFRCTSRRVAWSHCLKDKKLAAVVVVIILAIILIIFLFAMGIIPTKSIPNPTPNPSPSP